MLRTSRPGAHGFFSRLNSLATGGLVAKGPSVSNLRINNLATDGLVPTGPSESNLHINSLATSGLVATGPSVSNHDWLLAGWI